jgi:hypothetical protein
MSLTRSVRSRRLWPVVSRWPLAGSEGIPLGPDGPAPGAARGRRAARPLLAVAVTALTAAQFAGGRPFTALGSAPVPVLADDDVQHFGGLGLVPADGF